MSASKTFLISLAGGLTLATLLHVAAFSLDNRKVTAVLLWQDTLFFYLTGPGPLLFVDDQGTPHYEGTPVIMLVLPFGFAISVVIYSVVTFFFLKIFAWWRGPASSRE